MTPGKPRVEPAEGSALPRLVAAGAWLSARYPLVWRTRVLLFLVIGVTASVVVALVATTAAIRRESLPGLSSVVSALSYWSFLLYGVLLLLLVDVVRRTRPIFSTRHALRMFGCVAVSVVALLVPQYVFMRAVIPRIAVLETESDLATLMQRQEKIRFGRCIEHLFDQRYPPSALEEIIERDFRRYGLAISSATEFRPDCPGGHRLVVRRADANEYATEYTPIDIFEDRVRNIEAAQLFARHAGGAYETVVMGHAWAIVLVAALTAGLAGFISRTLILRSRFRARRRLFGRRKWRRFALRLDRRLARGWPATWSSRVHASLPQILTFTSLAFLLPVLSDASVDAAVMWIGIPSLVLSLFWLLRTQERVRSLPTRLSHEVGVFLIHAAVFASAALGIAALLGVLDELDGETVAVTLWGGLVLCAILQAARNSSAVMAYGGLIGAALLFSASVASAIFLLRALLSDAPDDDAVFVASSIIVSSAIASCAYFIGIEGRPTVRRLLISSLVVLGPVPGIALTIQFLTPNPSDVTTFRMLVSFVISVATTTLVLRLTENTRRAMAYSAK